MKSIILLIESLEVGGAENSLIDLYRDLSINYQVKVISLKLFKREEKLKIPVFNLYSKKSLSINSIWKLIKFFYIKKEILVISFSPECAVISNIANLFLLKKHKTCLSFRNSFLYYKSFNKIYTFLLHMAAIIPSDGIHFLTEANKNSYSKNYIYNLLLGKKVVSVIPNRIRSFKNIKPGLINRIGKPQIIFIARLTEQKQPFEFIEFCKLVNEEFPNKFSFNIFGDGHLRNEIINYINKLSSINDFRVFKKTSQIDKFISNPYALIFTSLYEGHPGVVGEAIISGIPVFSYPYDSFILFLLKSNKISGLSKECNPRSLYEEFIFKYNNMPISEEKAKEEKKLFLDNFSEININYLWHSFLYLLNHA